MATLLGALLVSLGLDSGQFRSGLTDAEKQMKATQRTFERIGNNLSKLGAVVTVGITAPFTALVASAVPAAVESQKALAQVNASLASMGPVAGRTTEQLQALAGALQDTSVFDDDDILVKVTANLLTFGAVSGDVFDRAQQDIVDLSAKFGKDLQESTIMVGKALQDPIKGLTALTRVGLSFTPVQAEMIKGMARAGNVAGAQRAILAALETQTSKAAQAQRDATPTAAMDQAWRTFQENIGAVGLKALPALTNAVSGLLNAFNELSPGLQSTIIGTTAVAAAVAPLLGAFGAITRIAAPVVAAMTTVTASVTATTAAEGVATTATGGLSAALRTLMISTGIGLALAGLAGAIYLVYQRSQEGKTASGAYAIAQDTLRKVHEQLEAATSKLATATGQERVQALAAAQAAREKAKAELARARANLVAAASELKLADAAQQKARVLANQGGMMPVGGGLGLPDMAGLGAQDRAGARVTQARTNMAAAQDVLAGLRAEIAKADHAINLTSIKIPAIGTGLEAAGKRGAKGMRHVKNGVDEAKKAADDLKRSLEEATQKAQSIIDRLFPDDAKYRQFKTDLADLEGAYKRGSLSADQLAEAQLRLRNEARGAETDFRPEGITEPITYMWNAAATTGDMISDTWGDLTKANARLGESFAQTTRNITSALQGLMSSFKSHDWLGALSGLADAFTQLAGGGLFGKALQKNANAFRDYGGGRALGGPVLPRTDYMIGERGPELLRMGSSPGLIVPNDQLMSGGGIAHIVPSPYFDVVVDGRVQRGAAPIAAAYTSAGLHASTRASALRGRQQLS